VIFLLYKDAMPNDSSPPSPQSVTLPIDTRALIDPAVLKIYANGFTLGLTNADAQLVLMLFGRPTAVLCFSYTLAKTLSQKLGKLVEDWEAKTGHPLQTTDSIDKAFSPATPEGQK
jgi:hypothetical protein